MSLRLPQAVKSLSIRNFRLYATGQAISVSGNWMQQIAIAWLVLKLTNSAFALGVSMALQSVFVLFLGPWGGLIADRIPKRRLLVVTQLLQMVPPLVLWMLTERNDIRIWMVYVLVACRGLINTVDNPARNSFIAEMVGGDRLVSAVSLNASIVQAGRLIGPAVASVVIATAGLADCFLLNGLSFLFMIAALLAMRGDELIPATRPPSGRGQLRAAIIHVRRTPDLAVPLILMGVVGLLSFNFTVVLPAVARFSLHGTATTYALMMNFLAIGALGGALANGSRRNVTPRLVAYASLAFGAALGLVALADTLVLTLILMLGVGLTSVTFSASVQAALQLTSLPEMRGRILALYLMVYQGTTPLGALLVGALAAQVGARSGFVLGAAGAIAAGAWGLYATRKGSRAAPIATAVTADP